MTTIAWVAVAIFVGAYVLIATERVHWSPPRSVEQRSFSVSG